jgi:hypothetical protein
MACGPYAPAFLGLAFGKERRIRVGFVAIVLLAAFVVLPGSLAWNSSRYLAPLVPAMLIGFADRRDNVVVFLAIFALGTGIWSAVKLQQAWALVAEDEWQLRKSLEAVPGGATVLIHDAGLIAWIKPVAHLVDVVGLKTPESADLHRRYTKRECQWDGALNEIAQRSKAQFVVVLDAPFWKWVGESLARAGWGLKLLPSSRHRVYRLTPPHRVSTLGLSVPRSPDVDRRLATSREVSRALRFARYRTDDISHSMLFTATSINMS